MGQAHQRIRIIAIVVGDEIFFRIAGHQLVALLETGGDYDRIQLRAQADQQLALHLERRRPVGRPFHGVRQRQADFAERFVGHPEIVYRRMELARPVNSSTSTITECSSAPWRAASIRTGIWVRNLCRIRLLSTPITEWYGPVI